jgi:hypothetical protein
VGSSSGAVIARDVARRHGQGWCARLLAEMGAVAHD